MIDMNTVSEREDAAIREVQEHDSPEGAPPPPNVRRRWWIILTFCVVALTVFTVAALILIDGAMALAVGLSILIGYGVVGGAVAILAVTQRAQERAHIKHRIERH